MKAGKNFLNLITSTDSFGDPIQFTINKSETPKTLIGGVLTSSLIILMLVLFIFQVRDPLGKLYPTISSFIDVKPQVGEMNFNKTTMAFAFSITDDEGHFYDETLFLTARIVKYTVENAKWKTNQTDLKLIKCTKEYFPNINETDFQLFRLDRYFCIKDQDVTIYGYQNSFNYTSLTFRASYCKEELVDGKGVITDDCKPEEQREKLYNMNSSSSIYVSLYFVNNIYNAKDYKKYKETYIENIYSYLDIEKIKYMVLNFNRQNLITDDGLIWFTEKTESLLSMEGVRMDTIGPGWEENLLSIINIHPSNKEYTSSRTYNKLTMVIAEVIGLHQSIWNTLKILCIVFANSKKSLILMNSLFEFDMKDRKVLLKKNNKVKKSLKTLNLGKMKENHILNRSKELNKSKAMDETLKKSAHNLNILNLNNDLNSKSLSEGDNVNNINNSQDLRRRSNLMMNSTLFNLKQKLNEIEELDIEHEPKAQFDDLVNKVSTRDYLDNNLKDPVILKKFEEKINYNFNYKDFINSDNDISLNTNYYTNKNVNRKNHKSLSEGKFIYVMNRVKPKDRACVDYFGKVEHLAKEKNINFSNQDKIKINLFGLCLKDKSLRKKYELFQMAEDKMADMFEITYVMNKLEEIEKLKAILFNKEQFTLFHMLMKEPCSLNSDFMMEHEYNKVKEYQCDIGSNNIEIEKFKSKIKNRPHELDDVDDRLFNLLPNEMKEILIIDKQSN